MNKKPKAYNLEKIHKAVRNERKGYFKRDNGPHCWKIYFVRNKILGINIYKQKFHPAVVIAENEHGEIVVMNITHNSSPKHKETFGYRMSDDKGSYLVKELVAKYSGKKLTVNDLGKQLKKLSFSEKQIFSILKKINRLPIAKSVYKDNKKNDTH